MSSLSSFTSDGAILIDRWYVLLYEYNIIQHVDVSTGILVRKVAKHLILQSSVETFDYGGFQILSLIHISEPTD